MVLRQLQVHRHLNSDWKTLMGTQSRMRLHIARDIATLFVLEYQSACLRSTSVRDQHTLMPEFPQGLCWEAWTLIPIQKYL